MLENFNMKEFLMLSLNDGGHYFGNKFDVYADCGCIKGITYLACNDNDQPEPRDQKRNTATTNLMNEARVSYPRFAKALDVAERILLKGHPQAAKLYLSHVVEKFNLLEPHKAEINLEPSRHLYKQPSEIHFIKGSGDTFAFQFAPELKKVRDTVKTTLNKEVVKV